MSFTIITGINGSGKTSLAYELANEACFDEERNVRAKEALLALYKEKGIVAPIPKHFVYVNQKKDVFFEKEGYYPRKAHKFKMEEFGIKQPGEKDCKYKFFPFYSFFVGDEIQIDVPSRSNISDVKPGQFKAYDETRHGDYDFVLTTPRFKNVDVKIRSLATGIYVHKKEVVSDEYDNVFIRWFVDEIPVGAIDLYDEASAEDKHLYCTPKIITSRTDIHKIYDPKGERDLFVGGFDKAELIVED